ncbi:hypothetical protein NECID01_1494 [Nematocida sp. AWRm77]|nr:hypothetical protein NECID01_1494 [Nematocida sp. AWRm77]
MKKPGVIILTFITFVTICICQIEVDLTLKNNRNIRVTVPKDAFQTIHQQGILDSSDIEDSNSSSPKNTTAEEKDQPIPYPCEFESETEYEQFRQLWDIDSPVPPAECNPLSQEQASHTADLFEKCLLTANYLNIQGEYAKRFFKNMVNYGLLGTHSADIMSSKVFSTYNMSRDTFWDLLQAFLRQIDFAYRMIICPSAGPTVLSIEKINAQFKQIDKEYTGLSQTVRIHTVLYSRLGPALSPEKERNEEVFAWLLLNIGGSSVEIWYTIKDFSDDITDLSQTIKQFTKENKQGGCVYVEGLKLNICGRKHSFSLHSALQHIPGLSRLGLFNTSADRSNTAPSSLISIITLCQSLKTLKIAGKRLENAEVSSLAESLPNIEKLSICCNRLEGTGIDSLKKCVQLEKLEIWGKEQPSTAVQALDTHLPSLRELYIWCKSLDPAAAEAFKTCPKLEKLKINGCGFSYQSSAVLQTILIHLPSLKELSIRCNALTPAAAEAFQACTQLEKLEINGCGFSYQPNTVVQALLTHLSSLKHLKVGIYIADFALADALRNCPNLRSLELKVYQYMPGFLARYLEAPLPRLPVLSLYNHDENHTYSEEDKRAVKKARAKRICILAL